MAMLKEEEGKASDYVNSHPLHRQTAIEGRTGKIRNQIQSHVSDYQTERNPRCT